uniref:DDE Tnp4 domain-containing protein n=1 Tax=Angiostrongylus cantonensis TaxID=6313 RepID=A0A0K0DKD7_ANGCA
MGHVSSHFEVSELIKANLKTLRIVGRIGLTEALVLNSSVHLERLSLMMFDLGFEVSQSTIDDHLLKITTGGATFQHLSYTGFIGLDPTSDIVQVRHINHLELGEVVDKPNIFNSLITYENVFKKGLKLPEGMSGTASNAGEEQGSKNDDRCDETQKFQEIATFYVRELDLL